MGRPVKFVAEPVDLNHADEGNEMVSCQSVGKVLVIARRAANADHPGKAAFDEPMPRQQDKAALGLGMREVREAAYPRATSKPTVVPTR